MKSFVHYMNHMVYWNYVYMNKMWTMKMNSRKKCAIKFHIGDNSWELKRYMHLTRNAWIISFRTHHHVSFITVTCSYAAFLTICQRNQYQVKVAWRPSHRECRFACHERSHRHVDWIIREPNGPEKSFIIVRMARIIFYCLV